MYNVSNTYKQVVKQPNIYSKLRINIDGTNYTDDNVLQGAFNINNKCSESTDVTLGSVYVGELSVTFLKNIGIARNTWKNRVIKPYYRLKIGDNTYEEVPLGVFVVDEATYSASGIGVKAYDYMTKFDKKIVLNQSSGFAYAFLSLACSNCSVTLGMTENEVQALPNGSTVLTYYSENDVETWRDLIFRVAQILGGFATINRLGQLIIKNYPTQSIDTIDIYHRTNSSKFSDYITSYTGMSYVSISDNHTHYHGLPDDTGLTMNLGSNPFLQDGTDTYINGLCNNILSAMQNIVYTPYDITLNGNPAYDLGDMIECTDGLAGTSSNCCIMSYTFNNHQGFSIKGYGKDPALSTARSKVDKDISGLMDKTSENSIIFSAFTNADVITIGDGNEAVIIDIKFASAKATYMIFMAEILGTVTTTSSGVTYNDATIKITYVQNNEEITAYHPTQTVVDGKHIVNLSFAIPVDNNVINNWKVKLEMDGGSISIPAENIKATIYGQGLVATEEWDGYLDFMESFGVVNAEPTLIVDMTETVTTWLDIPYTRSLTDSMSVINLNAVEITSITEYPMAYITETSIVDADNPPFYDISAVEIDSGVFKIISGATTPQYLTQQLIDVDYLDGVVSLSVTGSNITLQFSDDGSTWKSYVSNAWVTSATEMTINDATSLTSEDWMKLAVDGELWVRIDLNVSNSTFTSLSMVYREGVE